MDDTGESPVRAPRTARRIGWATLAIALGLGLWAAGKLYAYSLEPYRDGVQREPLNEAFSWLLAGGTSLAIAIVAFIVAEARRVGRWQPELVVTAVIVPALLAWGLFSLDRQRQIDVTLSRGFRSGVAPAPLPGQPQPWLVNGRRAAEVALRAIDDLQARPLFIATRPDGEIHLDTGVAGITTSGGWAHVITLARSTDRPGARQVIVVVDARNAKAVWIGEPPPKP